MTSPHSPSSPGKVYFWLTIVTILWSFHYIACKVAYPEVHPFFLAFLRITVTGTFYAISLLWLKRTGKIKVLFSKDLLRDMLPLSLVGIIVNQYAFLYGLYRTVPSHSVLITCLSVLFVYLYGVWRFHDRCTKINLLGLFLSFVGILLLDTRHGFHLQTQYAVGDVVTLLSASSFAAMILLSKRAISRHGPWVTTAWSYVLAIPFSCLVSWPFVHLSQLPHLSGVTYFSLGYIIIVVSIFVYSIYLWTLSKIEVSRVSVFTFLQPVFVILLSLLLSQEMFTLSIIAGGLPILLGLYLSLI